MSAVTPANPAYMHRQTAARHLDPVAWAAAAGVPDIPTALGVAQAHALLAIAEELAALRVLLQARTTSP